MADLRAFAPTAPEFVAMRRAGLGGNGYSSTCAPFQVAALRGGCSRIRRSTDLGLHGLASWKNRKSSLARVIWYSSRSEEP